MGHRSHISTGNQCYKTDILHVINRDHFVHCVCVCVWSLKILWVLRSESVVHLIIDFHTLKTWVWNRQSIFKISTIQSMKFTNQIPVSVTTDHQYLNHDEMTTAFKSWLLRSLPKCKTGNDILNGKHSQTNHSRIGNNLLIVAVCQTWNILEGPVSVFVRFQPLSPCFHAVNFTSFQL